MKEFNQQAEKKDFVKIQNVITEWMIETFTAVNKETAINRNLLVDALNAATGDGFLVKLASDVDHKSYIDTTADIRYTHIWNHLVIEVNNPHLRAVVEAVCACAEGMNQAAPQKLREGFEAICAAAPKSDVSKKDGSIQDFSTVFEKIKESPERKIYCKLMP
jgi:hypothetical protein